MSLVNRFQDRHDAGVRLARVLRAYASASDTVVLALPRGGVPVAYEIALALRLPWDVFEVRKMGVPGHEEFAMGAVASGGVRVLNPEIIRVLHISEEQLAQAEERESRELVRRERAYHQGRESVAVRGKTVILADDGMATGASMRAAIGALRAKEPGKIVVAVPVAAREVCELLRGDVDDVVCCEMPEELHAVGAWYEDFSQLTDEDVRRILALPLPATCALPNEG